MPNDLKIQMTPIEPAFASTSVNSFAKQITVTWRKAAASIVETGQKLLEARQSLAPSEFLALKQHLSDNEGISEATMSKLQMIARHPILSQTKHFGMLPPSYTVLYRLTQADEMAVKSAILNGDLSSSIQMKDVEEMFFKKAKNRTAQQSSKKTRKCRRATNITIAGLIAEMNEETQNQLANALDLVAQKFSVQIVEI